MFKCGASLPRGGAGELRGHTLTPQTFTLAPHDTLRSVSAWGVTDGMVDGPAAHFAVGSEHIRPIYGRW